VLNANTTEAADDLFLGPPDAPHGSIGNGLLEFTFVDGGIYDGDGPRLESDAVGALHCSSTAAPD